MTRRRRGGVRRSLPVGRQLPLLLSSCHYCGGPASTRDHIVPRRLWPLGGLTPDEGQGNVVPACPRCNGRKNDQRSDCACNTCLRAWTRLGPPDWQTLPVIPLATCQPPDQRIPA